MTKETYTPEEFQKITNETLREIWEILCKKSGPIATLAILNSTVITYYRQNMTKETLIEHVSLAWDHYDKEAKKDV